jgi:hypothetical protein
MLPILFHPETKLLNRNLKFSFFALYNRPLEKEKTISLVSCFIESLFLAVDRGSFGKGQSVSPSLGVPENSAVTPYGRACATWTL